MKAQIIKNMPFDEYLSLDRLSSSALKNFIECPDYYKWQKSQPQKEPSAAFKKGTMIHTWMLENHTFQNLYYAMPEIDAPVRPEGADGRAKAGTPEKELYLAYKEKLDKHEETMAIYIEAAGDREVVKESEINKYKHLPSRSDTDNEVTVLFEHEGVPCKARFDMLHRNKEENGVEDLKTIADIFKIDRDFFKFKYDVQLGFYTIAYYEAFNEWPDFFKFTFVSTGDYPAMVTRNCDFALIERSRSFIDMQIKSFYDCISNNNWPGIYSGDIELPRWM